MPVDPGISLQVTGGDKGFMQAGGGGNPLAMIEGFAGTAEKLNELKLFQAKFAARQKAGKILAEAPDLPTGIKILQQDPDTAAWAPELAQSAMDTQNAVLEGAKREQDLNFDAFHNTLGYLAAAVNDPGQMATIKSSALAMASPLVRGKLASSLDKIDEALSTAETPEKRLQLITGWATAGNHGEAMKNVLGEQRAVNFGGRTGFGVQAPAQGGPLGQAPGAFSETNAVGNTLSPTLGSPDSMPVGGDGTGGGRKGTGNPVALPLPGRSTPKVSADGAPTPAPISGLGTPLFDSKTLTEMHPPSDSTRTIGGGPGNPQARDLLVQFGTDERHVYNNANLTRAQLGEMSGDIDSMAKNGGFLVPGTGAEFRVGLAKFAKMIGDVTGADLGVDAEKVATAEDMMKATQRMGITYLNTALGAQREAAETIKNITTKGVPGINNTYLGSKMLIGMIGALNDRAIDQYNFKTTWANKPKNNSDLRGADTKFNEKFPAKAYIDKALSDLGMTETGFKSRADIDSALAAKLITPEQAEVIRQNKGKVPASLPKAE